MCEVQWWLVLCALEKRFKSLKWIKEGVIPPLRTATKWSLPTKHQLGSVWDFSSRTLTLTLRHQQLNWLYKGSLSKHKTHVLDDICNFWSNKVTLYQTGHWEKYLLLNCTELSQRYHEHGACSSWLNANCLSMRYYVFHCLYCFTFKCYITLLLVKM